MPTREQVTAALRAGDGYEDVGRHFGIPPGQAYLIATGLPADGSDALGPDQLAERADYLLGGSSQHLANPPADVAAPSDAVREWIRSRVAADEPLRSAERSRVVEPPPPEPSEDVVDVLGSQHNQVKYLQEQLEAIPGVTKGGTAEQQSRRESILDLMRVRLAKHETAEEIYFWPAVREHVEDGDALADEAMQQEQQGNELLKQLERLAGSDPGFDELATQLNSALRKHVAFEDAVFLRVKAELPADERQRLGRAIAQAEPAGPTRSHPRAPKGSKAAAAAAAPLDRARDAAGERPAKRRGKAK